MRDGLFGATLEDAFRKLLEDYPEIISGKQIRPGDDDPPRFVRLTVPTDLYTKSPRPYTDLGELDYPIHDWTATVTSCGRICYKHRKINLSTVFAGQKVDIK